MTDTLTLKTETFTLSWEAPVHPTINYFVGKLNAYTWRGHPAGHVMFSGLESTVAEDLRRTLKATFVVRKGRRWDEYTDVSGEWHLMPGLFRLVNFADLGIPADAVMSEPVEDERSIVVPDPSPAESWRERPPLL